MARESIRGEVAIVGRGIPARGVSAGTLVPRASQV